MDLTFRSVLFLFENLLNISGGLKWLHSGKVETLRESSNSCINFNFSDGF